jgi:chromosome segregation ATPase
MPADSKGKAALDIEQLKKKHKELERQKTTAEANFKTATDQLEAIKAEARQKYGTDDLDALRKRLAEMKQSNESKRAQYQKHLEEIEVRLAQVEKEFANPGGAVSQ